MESVNLLLENKICEIMERINNAALKSGRTASDITLIAVTKYISSEILKKAQNLGLKNFGESRAQELITKYNDIPDINWHFIGRLQTNKVKYIVDKVCLIHSLDRIELAREIDWAAKRQNLTVNALVQVNISDESTKAGISPEYCEEFLKEIAVMKNISVRGLMTIVPFTEKKNEIKQNFSNLHKLFIDIQRKKIHNINMDYLSAGMTNDFETAIEEGANMVRIGTGLFGDRQYPALSTKD